MLCNLKPQEDPSNFHLIHTYISLTSHTTGRITYAKQVLINLNNAERENGENVTYA